MDVQKFIHENGDWILLGWLDEKGKPDGDWNLFHDPFNNYVQIYDSDGGNRFVISEEGVYEYAFLGMKHELMRPRTILVFDGSRDPYAKYPDKFTMEYDEEDSLRFLFSGEDDNLGDLQLDEWDG